MNEMNYNDNDLREALRRKNATTPTLPDDFFESLSRKVSMQHAMRRKWKWSAVAASIIIIGIGAYMVPLNRLDNGKPKAPVAEMQRKTTPPRPLTQLAEIEEKAAIKNKVGTRARKKRSQAPQPPAATAKKESAEMVENENHLHFATYTPTADSAYQPPSRMDKFIAKMAEYNKVEAISLECGTDEEKLPTVGTAYVFPDQQELDVFGRLLQAACWYDSNTPGYLLNFSHQQFFFCLKDPLEKKQYFWIAERINGNRILLFCTHSPIGADKSAACYQQYRDKLTNTDVDTLNN